MSKQYCVYIMASRSRVLYVGVTNDLQRRVEQHKQKVVEGFTQKIQRVTWLVYYESTNVIQASLNREKELKGWLRKKKIALIESANPQWKDLSEDWN